jgi:hypothetical protein
LKVWDSGGIEDEVDCREAAFWQAGRSGRRRMRRARRARRGIGEGKRKIRNSKFEMSGGRAVPGRIPNSSQREKGKRITVLTRPGRGNSHHKTSFLRAS